MSPASKSRATQLRTQRWTCLARLQKAAWAGLVMLAVFSASPAFGATITVTNNSDSGTGSLRAAIASASPGDTINFSLTYPATITLASTLTISTSVTIIGPGASSLFISGGNSVQVFSMSTGVTVAISGLTIQNGNANNGGGIYNNGGTVTLSNCTLSGNSAPSGGGGGIFNNGGTLTLSNCTLSGNSAFRGGGIWNGNLSTLNLVNSTLSGNTASDLGGGIWNTSLPGSFTSQTASTLNVINSTLSGNTAASESGGGIYNGASVVTVINSTLSGNSAGLVAGGIENDIGTLLVKNTIVANSTGGNCSLTLYGTTITTSQGHNLSDDATCSSFLNQAGDLNNTPAVLDPNGLKNNGGPTQTIALLASSPAVDAIPVSPTNYCTATDETTLIATDQRGVTRPQGPACDIGAYELIENVQKGSITSNFNGTPIGGRNIVWFNSVLKVQGLGASPVNVYLTNATIQFVAGGTPYNLSVPNATITFSPTATSATTTYDAGSNSWLTTVPSSGLAGNTFLDALAFLVPGGGLPGGIKVTWQGSFASDTPGIMVDWKWGAAVYTSFGTDYNAEGVKPVDDNKASVYNNSDHAGTPENFKGSVIGGATGGGGSNFTGGYSGTQTIQF